MANEREEKVDLEKQIKNMERKNREEARKRAAKQEAVGSVKSDDVAFDAWYALRASSIPSKHMKEILRADFTGRGLGNKEPLAKFDKALEQYGVKLG